MVMLNVIERLLYNEMFDFAITNNHISTNQSGFKTGDSCINNFLFMNLFLFLISFLFLVQFVFFCLFVFLFPRYYYILKILLYIENIF